MFERWGEDEESRFERVRAAGSLTAIGLGLIFLITLLQSGYVYRLPADAPQNFFLTIVRNLQNGGPVGDPVVGSFATDHLTMIGRLVLIGAAFLVSLLTLDYRPANNPGEFYALILLSTMGMCLMAAATELITAYLSVELTSIPLYILAGYFQTNTRQSSEAGMKYFLFGALSSGLILYGMSLVFGFAVASIPGGAQANDMTQFLRIAQATATEGAAASKLLTLGMLFIIAGVGYKVAVIPFHSWSPDVYEGSLTPITAFLSTASKAAGFLLLYRILVTAFPNLTGTAEIVSGFGGWTSLLAVLAVATVVLGNLAALPQRNLKRLLAWSSIAHAGFVIMALMAWASPYASTRSMGTSALIYYLVVYTVTNIGAFGALAVASMTVGGDTMEHLRGLARRNLGLATLLAIFVLSLAGIPPMGGFLAKFYIFMAAWQSGAWWVVMTGVVTTMIGLYYYLLILKATFIEEPASTEPVPMPTWMNATLITSAVLVLLLGVFPNLVLTTIDQVKVVAGM
ncbi:MAG: NADH-quinone oxidoreductase subunit N [Chloroflexaceae bacterium]|nr:NADH-quinone oxidoreductase subunit N [Chloroflexaceae bacterium]